MTQSKYRDAINEKLGAKNYDINKFWQLCPYTYEQITKRTRTREIMFHRQCGMVFYYMNGYTLTAAGKIFKKDHATVLHAIRNIISCLDVPNDELQVLWNEYTYYLTDYVDPLQPERIPLELSELNAFLDSFTISQFDRRRVAGILDKYILSEV